MDMPSPSKAAPDAPDDLQTVLEHLSTGTPLDPELKRRVRERAGKIRQEIRNRHGVVEVAVELIRETRDDG